MKLYLKVWDAGEEIRPSTLLHLPSYPLWISARIIFSRPSVLSFKISLSQPGLLHCVRNVIFVKDAKCNKVEEINSEAEPLMDEKIFIETYNIHNI